MVGWFVLLGIIGSICALNMACVVGIGYLVVEWASKRRSEYPKKIQ